MSKAQESLDVVSVAWHRYFREARWNEKQRFGQFFTNNYAQGLPFDVFYEEYDLVALNKIIRAVIDHEYDLTKNLPE